jgi:hypothetical protein
MGIDGSTKRRRGKTATIAAQITAGKIQINPCGTVTFYKFTYYINITIVLQWYYIIIQGDGWGASLRER